MKHISFPSTDQFRNVVANINRQVSYIGLDANGDAIYDPSIQKPTLTFTGTVKLHGTNAGVCFNNKDGFWVQSRENIITIEKDNAGFAMFSTRNQEVLTKMMVDTAKENDVDLDKFTMSLYGEWAGPGIQKTVGISMLPQKSLFIFGIKYSDELDPHFGAHWLDNSKLKSEYNFIYNINDFKTFSVDIDFNMPQMIQNKLIELTIAVEEECPVAKHFGNDNTLGEGIVFICEYKDVVYRFKSKGEKYAAGSKPKVLRVVDNERLKLIVDTAEKVTPVWRLEQMLEKTFDFMNGGELDRAKLGDYIRFVINDIVKEDIDILIEANLELKDVSKHVSDISRKYFFSKELI